jgi:hypothetical protein
MLLRQAVLERRRHRHANGEEHLAVTRECALESPASLSEINKSRMEITFSYIYSSMCV